MTFGRWAACVLPSVLAVMLAACSGTEPGGTAGPANSGTPAATQAGGSPTSLGPSATLAPSASQGAGDETFANPVMDADFPDPFVANFNGTYYAYATGTSGKLIQVSQSSDLVSWSPPGEALLRAPRWIASDTWAPEVAETSAGYVMYYSGRNPGMVRSNGEGALCLSTAVADTPAGPFRDQSDSPFLCQPDLGGSIDPTTFTDEDGTLHLVWKNDGNCCGIPTRFWMQELSDDGLELVGDQAIDLGVENDERWEGGVIEAPTLLERDGTYYLFYSANRYDTHRYAVGYATSDTLTGPYTDAAENPILSYAAPAVGPGHQSIVEDGDGQLWIVYHAWDVDAIGYGVGGRRALWIDPLTFEGEQPVVAGPNASPQLAPETY